jgi:hypothetical protein
MRPDRTTNSTKRTNRRFVAFVQFVVRPMGGA